MPGSVTTLQVFILTLINSIATLSIVDKGLLPIIKNSVGLQFFIDIENENRQDSCTLRAQHQKCCLSGLESDDCEVIQVYAPSNEELKPKDRKTLLYISPSVHQHDLNGQCNFKVHYKCNNFQDKLEVNIPLNTRINENLKVFTSYLRDDKPSDCETIDQDALDDCFPVHCDLKYLGHRLFYDSTNRCIDVPNCLGNPNKDLPDLVYVPDANSCRNLEMPITVEDVFAITSGLGVVTQTTADDDLYLEVKSNCSTISQNINLIRDLMYGKLCPSCDTNKEIDFSDCCKSAMVSIVLYLMSIVAVLFSFICCVHTLVWVYGKKNNGSLGYFWNRAKARFEKTAKCKNRRGTDEEVRNALLRDVIVKDIPIELRHSVVNICDRMGEEVGKRRRYREAEIGSHISFTKSEYCNSSDAISD